MLSSSAWESCALTGASNECFLCAGIITQHLQEVPHEERLNQLHKLLKDGHSQNLSCCLHALQQELKEPKVAPWSLYFSHCSLSVNAKN